VAAAQIIFATHKVAEVMNRVLAIFRFFWALLY